MFANMPSTVHTHTHTHTHKGTEDSWSTDLCYVMTSHNKHSYTLLNTYSWLHSNTHKDKVSGPHYRSTWFSFMAVVISLFTTGLGIALFPLQGQTDPNNAFPSPRSSISKQLQQEGSYPCSCNGATEI